MAGQFSKTDQRRITFLSLLNSASSLGGASSPDDAYDLAKQWLGDMEADGFFEEERAPNPTSQRSGRSDRQASSSRPSRSSDRPSNGRRGFSGNYRNADGPPTEKQVAAVLKRTDDYTEDELWDMTKQEVGELLSDLIGD